MFLSFSCSLFLGSVTIIDLDTKITTTKKLTYPLPYINRIYYGYAQSVESKEILMLSRLQLIITLALLPIWLIAANTNTAPQNQNQKPQGQGQQQQTRYYCPISKE